MDMPRFARRGSGLSGLVLAASLLATPSLGRADVTLIPTGSTFRYLDNGSNQGTAWRATGFSDASWASGAAQLGYGDGDEATVVSYGPSSTNRYITTYFRRAFSVADPSVYSSLALRILRDDGAVVYLNGVEVFRTNMPSTTVGYTTLASTAIGNAAESTFYPATAASSLLTAGSNVIAVEIHQSGATSSDISFDFELVGVTAAASYSVVRGPYLQKGTQSGVTVRWRTNAPTDSVVRYGSSPTALTQSATLTTLTSEHEVSLAALAADTRYYYAVGSSAEMLAGGDATTYFETSPVPGSAAPIRIWVLGDSGTADAGADAVYNAYRTYTGSTHTDLWLMLGDNAYDDGTDSEYQAAVFDTYPQMLRQSVVWPTLGNHDGATADSATQSGPYYDIFSLPRSGEAGGVASGTEAYYAFDHGNVHFVVLDSYDSSRATSGAMLTWLAADLAAAQSDWLVAFWHHPPYSKGSHNSDTETQLVEMRQNALPLLEAYGVDLVLTGHSHSYERSFLLDGHYGSSGTLLGNHIKDGGDGRADGDGAYRKPTTGLAAHEGAVYAVAGSSGKTEGGPLNHPAMFVSLNQLGSMVLDVAGNSLQARFLNSSGVIADHFELVKGPASCTPSESPEQSCADAADNDCDGLTDGADPDCCPDADDDGYAASSCGGSDCNDAVSAINPGVVETCDNGSDDDCDAASDCQDSSCLGHPACGPVPRTVTLTALQDAFVRSTRATTRYGTATSLQVDTSPERERVFIRPDNLGNIQPGAQVLSAFLYLTVYDVGSQVQVREVLASWSEASITWNTQPATATVAEATFTASQTGQVVIDVTGLAQSWVDGAPAHGVQLYPTGSNGVEFRSSEYTTVSARPRFVLEVLE
jgi:hypothetical protein